MARGQSEKAAVAKKILETFEGSFEYDKKIRIPMNIDGEDIQVAVALTAAKTNVSPGGDVILPGSEGDNINAPQGAPAASDVQVSEEEKQKVTSLLESLGL